MLKPIYSFEFNQILNENFNEIENIKNFASLISDKDRFFLKLQELEKILKGIEEKLGYKLPEDIEFYIVRAEKFTSFSPPITIEYNLEPEIMILRLLKEIIASTFPERFAENKERDQFILGFIKLLIENKKLKISEEKYKDLLNETKKKYEKFEIIPFKGDKLLDKVKKYYLKNPIC